MPRQIITDRINGCLVQSHIGGEEQDEFKLLDQGGLKTLFSFTALSTAQKAAKVVHGLRQLGEGMDDASEFSDFMDVVGGIAEEQEPIIRERQLNKERKKEEAAVASQRPMGQSPPTAPKSPVAPPSTPVLDFDGANDYVDVPLTSVDTGPRTPPPLAETPHTPLDMTSLAATPTVPETIITEEINGTDDPGRVRDPGTLEGAGGDVRITQPAAPAEGGAPDAGAAAGAPAVNEVPTEPGGPATTTPDPGV